MPRQRIPPFFPLGKLLATIAEGMRVRLPTTVAAEEGLPSEESPSKSKPAQASLLHRLLNRHTILLLMLALTVRRSALTHVCTAPS